MNMISSWGRAFRRVLCCGPGADESETSGNEPIYQTLEEHQDHEDAVNTLQSVVEVMNEIRQLLAPIADVPDRIRRLELNLHPLLFYRPEDGEYMEMRTVPRPVAAAQAPEPPACSVWQSWLQERVDYGEPW